MHGPTQQHQPASLWLASGLLAWAERRPPAAASSSSSQLAGRS
jgi:hypothetical protein